MSLIKTFLLEIQDLGFNPYKLNDLSENDWDILITKALSKDKKITQITNIITQSTVITLKAFEGQQKLNESQREVNHALKDGLKDLFNAISKMTSILTGGKN